MKIEMDDNSSIVTTVSTFVVVVVLAILAGCHMTEETNRQAIKAGLVQKQQLTPGQPVWSKP